MNKLLVNVLLTSLPFIFMTSGGGGMITSYKNNPHIKSHPNSATKNKRKMIKKSRKKNR